MDWSIHEPPPVSEYWQAPPVPRAIPRAGRDAAIVAVPLLLAAATIGWVMSHLAPSADDVRTPLGMAHKELNDTKAALGEKQAAIELLTTQRQSAQAETNELRALSTSLGAQLHEKDKALAAANAALAAAPAKASEADIQIASRQGYERGYEAGKRDRQAIDDVRAAQAKVDADRAAIERRDWQSAVSAAVKAGHDAVSARTAADQAAKEAQAAAAAKKLADGRLALAMQNLASAKKAADDASRDYSNPPSGANRLELQQAKMTADARSSAAAQAELTAEKEAAGASQSAAVAQAAADKAAATAAAALQRVSDAALLAPAAAVLPATRPVAGPAGQQP